MLKKTLFQIMSLIILFLMQSNLVLINLKLLLSCWNEKDFTYLTIEDFGIGMSQEIQENIFKSNVKTNSVALNGEVEIGLNASCFSLYEKYDGDIFVNSIEDRGTRFTLKFKNHHSNIEESKQAS